MRVECVQMMDFEAVQGFTLMAEILTSARTWLVAFRPQKGKAENGLARFKVGW
jgi:hypothetical protein